MLIGSRCHPSSRSDLLPFNPFAHSRIPGSSLGRRVRGRLAKVIWIGGSAPQLGDAESARGISPRAAHRSGLDTLASSGSCHRVKAAAFRCMSGSSRCRLTRPNVGDPLPSLHGHYTRFITTTEQSAPLRRIGTFGLAVVAACAFSLVIAGQVLTFRTRAWLSFAPSTCRMPLGPYQDISRADPAGRVTPRF